MDNAVVNYQIGYNHKSSEPRIQPRDKPTAINPKYNENGFEQQVRLLNDLSDKLDEYFSIRTTRFMD